MSGLEAGGRRAGRECSPRRAFGSGLTALPGPKSYSGLQENQTPQMGMKLA